MKHSIPVSSLGTHGQPMADAVQACVHCGFCLPACPTYQVMEEEMDSPRGRIVLMKGVLEGALPLAAALPRLDACLGCLACETACPSGVRYRELISPFRAMVEERRARPLGERLRRWLLLQVLPHPVRFAFVAGVGVRARPLRKWLPRSARAMLELLPPRLPSASPLAGHYAPEGKARARVALLTGCVQNVLAPGINRATVEVLLRNGVEVVIPRGQGCCGALAWHVGAGREAGACALRNLGAFPSDVDAIVTNAAGCGSCLHEYPLILDGDVSEAAADAFARKSVDVAEFLDGLGFQPPPDSGRKVVVAMQDACHLLHGQRVQGAPRRLLRSVPGLELREIAEAEICCGSAGTYNIDHPDTASELGGRKAVNLILSGAECVVSGNVGCLMQVRAHLAAKGAALRAMHTMEFLAGAYRGTA